QNTLSVLSGRTLEEIAADADSVWTSNGRSTRSTGKAKVAAAARTTSAPKAKRKGKKSSGDTSRRKGRPDPSKLANARKARLPATLAPQLATAVDRIPEGDNWLHELKFDGYRLLAFVDGTNVRLLTLCGHDWTNRIAAVARAIAELPIDQSVLDGEVVALDANGVS